MTTSILLTAALLVAIAAVGPLVPLRRRSFAPLDPVPDPLEERKRTLLLALWDLNESISSGALGKEQHERLRLETEARLARVLRVLEERPKDGFEVSNQSEEHLGKERGIPRWAAAALVLAAVAGGSVVSLLRSVGERAPGSVFTGSLPGAPQPSADDRLAFFEDRVGDKPDDVAARLDLAHRYLDAGRTGEAIDEYAAALKLDPDNAEAHAHMGLLLYMAGRPEGAIKAVERALSVDPDYPEALLFKGMILLKGLNRPLEAAEALRRYLESAPKGGQTEMARQLLAEAEAAVSSGS